MSTNHNYFEEKGEMPNRTETFVLTSLTPFRWAISARKRREVELGPQIWMECLAAELFLNS